MGLAGGDGAAAGAGYAGLDYDVWNPLSWWRAWRGAPRVDLREAAIASVGVLATHIGYLLRDEERLLRVWDDLARFVHGHGLRPVVGHRIVFEELPRAHALMESRRSMGKLVVVL